MQAHGTTPLSSQNVQDADFATRLVRVPKHLESSTEPGGASFEETLRDQMNPGKPAQARTSKNDKRLWDACIEMESLLVGKMLKEMRKTVPKTGWIDGGFAEEIFEDMLYDEYAMSLSKNSNLGMAKMLYDQMSRKL